jgi:hypothetical protein
MNTMVTLPRPPRDASRLPVTWSGPVRCRVMMQLVEEPSGGALTISSAVNPPTVLRTGWIPVGPHGAPGEQEGPRKFRWKLP